MSVALSGMARDEDKLMTVSGGGQRREPASGSALAYGPTTAQFAAADTR
jgi:hypothetical protein